MSAARASLVRWRPLRCCQPLWAERSPRDAGQYSGFCRGLGGEFRVITWPGLVRLLLFALFRANAGEPVTPRRLLDTLRLMRLGAGAVLVSLGRRRVAHLDGSC